VQAAEFRRVVASWIGDRGGQALAAAGAIPRLAEL
jgi:hypothetical protein